MKTKIEAIYDHFKNNFNASILAGNPTGEIINAFYFGYDPGAISQITPALMVVPTSSEFNNTVPRKLRAEVNLNIVIIFNESYVINEQNLLWADKLITFFQADESLGGNSFSTDFSNLDFVAAETFGTVDANFKVNIQV